MKDGQEQVMIGSTCTIGHFTFHICSLELVVSENNDTNCGRQSVAIFNFRRKWNRYEYSYIPRL